MKKALVSFIVMISTVSISSVVFAAAWYAPNNVRIVQKSNTDTTGRIYSSVQAAINSISNASASNPYLVKVMPGVFDLGTASVVMKDFVDLEGSGDSSVITSANVNIDDSSCTIGTVLMANNSAIRNVKIINSAADAGNSNVIAGVVFNNVKAKAEGITVLVGTTGVYGAANNGICSVGGAANAILNNINVEIRNSNGSANALELRDDGSATLTNSKLTASTTGAGCTHIVSCHEGVTMEGKLTVINTIIEGIVTPPADNNRGLWNDSCSTSISNSIIRLNDGIGIYTGGSLVLTAVNNQIYGSTEGVQADGSSNFANNLIQGTVPTNQPNVKLFNNYTENFVAIPNQ